MGRVRSLGLRASRGIGWRLTLAGTRMSARAVTDGEVEPRGESIDASSLLRNGWKAPAVDALFYFPDPVSKIYQIQQWLPVIAAHSGDINFGIVTRARSTWTELMASDLPAPSFLAMPFPGLMDLYRVLQPKAIIYPNNGLRNFQSLIWPEAVHIHVNHGESDKVSMVSNQAKSYDKVFVAGEAAVRRHRAALVDFNEATLVKIGRPQLDLNPVPTLPGQPATHRALRPHVGGRGRDEQLHVAGLLRRCPPRRAAGHPRRSGGLQAPPPRGTEHAAHGRQRTRQSGVPDRGGPPPPTPTAGHEYRPDGDILALFPRVDLLVSDISSVGLDFLYLRSEAPIVLTDRRTNRANLLREAPIAAAAHIVDADSIATARSDIAALLTDDRNGAARAELRAFYFDEAIPGESTRLFHSALLAAIAEHQAGLLAMRDLSAHGIWPVSLSPAHPQQPHRSAGGIGERAPGMGGCGDNLKGGIGRN